MRLAAQQIPPTRATEARKRLVEMHGGSVGASSEGPGCGSEFVVRLPVEAKAGLHTRNASEAQIVGNPSTEVLGVVDDPQNVFHRLVGHAMAEPRVPEERAVIEGAG